MKLFSRFAALALALALCLSILPAAVAEDVTQDKNQIVEAGGTVFYNDKGKEVKGATTLGGDAVVEMTKTVAGTDIENEFEITLQVKTTSRIDTITSGSTDAAVLLIVDLSSSMSEQSVWEGKTRLAAAKEALNKFVTQFASLKDENGNTISGKRMIGLVTFGSHAGSTNWNLVKDLDGTAYWIDVQKPTSSGTNANLETVKSEIDSLIAYSNKPGGPGGTNLEAALMLGRNLLKDGLGDDEGDSGAIRNFKHVYTILLTDGKPTWYVDGDSDSLSGINGTRTTTSTDKEDVEDVGKVANGYGTTKGITDYSKLYSICFGKDGNRSVFNSNLKENNDNGQGGQGGGGSNNWTVTIRKTNYTITNSTTVGDWLGAFSDAAYDGQSSNGQQSLFDLTFNSIIQQITLSIEAWRVTDTMGPYIQLVETYDTLQYKDADGNSGGSFTNSATHDKDKGIINWDILASTPDPRITDTSASTNPPVVGYTYKYKVRLNNLDGGYTAGTSETPTNESATLEYAVLKDGVFQANPNNTDGTYTATFPQPMVKGLVGNLTFKKVDGSGTALPGATFTLSSVEKNADGTSKWSSATATSGDDGTVTFSNIPSGHSYTLTETKAPDNYNLDSTPHTVEIKYGKAYKNYEQITETNPLKITNTAKTGSLTISKAFGEGGAITADSFPTGKTITFTVTGPDNYSKTVTLPENGQWTTTLTNVPLGTYTVTETNADVDNYSYTTTVKVNGTDEELTNNGVSVKVNAVENNSVTVAFTNNYTKTTGSLNIQKLFTFSPAPSTSPAPVATPSAITMVVTEVSPAPSTTPYTTEVILTPDSWSATVDNLPVGSYTVTENTDDAQILGWTLTTPTPTSKIVSPEDTSPVTITNTYTRDTGSLTIEKVFSGLPEGTSAPNISFTVTGPDGYTKTFERSEMTLANGQYSYTINDLPTGEYTVTEDANTAGVSSYTLSTTYSPTDGKVTVSKGNEAKVSITNTYTRDVGSLTVSKAWSYKLGTQSTPAPSNAPTQVTVNVVGPTSTSAILNADNGWATTIPNLPVGEYTVTEDQSGLSIEGWTLTVTGGNPTTSPAPVTKGETATAATITNTYERDTGKLTIKKEFSTSPETTARPAEITVNVSGYATPIKLNAANSWTCTIDNLPTGTYTITEDTNTAAITDYALAGTTYTDNATVTLGKGSDITVTITNTYTQNKGGLAISKKFNFVTPSPMVGTVTTPAPSDRPEIVVEVKDASSQPVATAILNQSNKWSTTIPDLPVGNYTVTEVNSTEHPLDITGWTLTTPAPTTVTVASNTTAPTVQFTNTYTRDTGSLTITKTISGLPDGTTPDIFFTVTGPDSYSETIYLKADQTQTDRKAMSMAADGTYSYQINNLPTGEYTVTETNAAVTDYSLSATVSVNGKPAQTLPANGVAVEVKAGEDNTATVVFTNTYSSTLGSLTIKKEFVNLSDNSKPQFIIIQVFGPTNSNFETTVSLNAANNWTDTISNLPTGEYTVTENTDNANLPGYNLTTTVKVGNDNAKTAASTTATVPAGGNVTVTFTNAYELKEAKKIELPITKVVTRGEKGNVDPTGARTFTFEAQIEELILGSLDDTPAVQPGEIVVQFNGETLTPKDNRYTFSITVNGAGKETGTLTIFTNEVSNLIVNVHELSQTDSGYAEDECWKYDESRYVFYPSIKDGINDKDYSLNGVHVITDEESFQLSEDDSITFTNVYTKTSTPEIEVPVTGDNSRIGLYMAMMLLSAAGLVVICKRRTAKR